MNYKSLKNIYSKNLFWNMIFTIICFQSCGIFNNIEKFEIRNQNNISLLGEWAVDIEKTLQENDNVLRSKIEFRMNESISQEMLSLLGEQEINGLLNLGISDLRSLSFLESGYMIQFSTNCKLNSVEETLRLPYCIINNLIDERIILFLVPDEPRFISVPLVYDRDYLYLKIHRGDKIFLKKKSPKISGLKKEYKNDLEIAQLKGKIMSIISQTYDGNEIWPYHYGRLENITREIFDEFGNSQSMVSENFGNSRIKKTYSYSGTFNNRLTSIERRGSYPVYTVKRLVEGTKITTYSKTDTTTRIINDLGEYEISSNQGLQTKKIEFYGNIINIKYDFKNGRDLTLFQKKQSNFDKHDNWLKETSYDFSNCETKRNRVTIRKIEYY